MVPELPTERFVVEEGLQGPLLVGSQTFGALCEPADVVQHAAKPRTDGVEALGEQTPEATARSMSALGIGKRTKSPARATPS